MKCELQTRYDSRASFYGKAEVEVGKDRLDLYSYGTLVASIINKENEKVAEIFGQYSQTTTRHQKEFLKQNGFKADSMKQMLKDYYKEQN